MADVTRDKSKPSKPYPSNRYDDSAKNRQNILQYLHANPGTTMSHVAWALKLTKERASQTLFRMEILKEVTYKDGEGVSRYGRKCRAYYAAVEFTKSADDMRDRVVDNLYGDGSGRSRTASSIPMHNGVRRLFGGLDV